MAVASKPKLAYVLPSYDPATGSHFFHLYGFLERAAEKLDLLVVIEQCRSRPAWPFGLYCQKFLFPPLRMLELIFILLRARLSGRRHFYVHYSFYGGLASWLVARLTGAQAYYWNCGEPWRYRRPWLEEAIFRFILRRTVLVTGTDGLAQEYRRRYGLKAERVRVLPNWVDVARFREGPGRDAARRTLAIPPETKVVLFVHRLSRRKGAHLIPEIAAEVTRQRKDAVLVIVGDGPERKNLESSIQNLEFAGQVRLAGEVPQRDIAPYYRAADVLLMPSEEEGFPHVLLEAMAAGIPYVASDVGGVREITPPELQAFIVPSGDTGAFAASISSLLTKPATEVAAISRREQQWVQRYDVQAALAQFTALFARKRGGGGTDAPALDRMI